MKATKCVWQHHDCGSQIQPAFDYFRSCTNEAIRIGIQKQISSKFALHRELYHKFREDFAAKFIYGALECAASKIKQHKKARKENQNARVPYIWKNILCIDNQSYKITNDQIRIFIKSNQYFCIDLTPYVLRQLESTKLGSVTITPSKIIITYSREVQSTKPKNFLGIDRNLNNITTFDTNGSTYIHDLEKATQIKQTYRRVRSHFTRNDARVGKRILQKYGTKEKNKVRQILHHVSKTIISEKKGIVLEDLKGIRKLYRKGNGRGKEIRAKMNAWSFYELQKQINYKARWVGLPVQYVNAYGTSSKCAICGSKLIPEEHRMLYCTCCKVIVDRDINAAKNILARGMKVVPYAVQGEAMKQSKDVKQIVLSQIHFESADLQRTRKINSDL